MPGTLLLTIVQTNVLGKKKKKKQERERNKSSAQRQAGGSVEEKLGTENGH